MDHQSHEHATTPDTEQPRKRVPVWLRVVLIGSAIWIGAVLARGVTYALTHAVHGL